MPECARIDALVTPFVDGALSAADEQAVARHIERCPPCRAKVSAERSVRALLHARCADLDSVAAPPRLKARCAALCSRKPGSVVPFPDNGAAAGASRAARWRARLTPVAAAAALILAVGSVLYLATDRSSRVLAAELATDHEKCFALNRLVGTQHTSEAVRIQMASTFDWHVRMPDTSSRRDVSLVGSRPCLYGKGKVAHIMFTHNGQPVSLFMLPNDARPDAELDVLGHRCRIWSEGERTFVLVARASDSSLDDMAAFVRSTIK
jgi:anti-sigma factor RsiW